MASISRPLSAGGGFVDPLGFNSPPPDPKPTIPPPILDAFAASNASANTSALNTSAPTPPAAAGPLPGTATTSGRKLLQGSVAAAAASGPEPSPSPAAASPQPSPSAPLLPGVLQQQHPNATAGGTNTTSSSAALNDLLPLDVSVKPLYVVPLKVVTGISSSFLTVLATPATPNLRALTGTEVL